MNIETINALEKDEEKNINLTTNQLKEMLVSAMLAGRTCGDDTPLTDWQIEDTKKWYFKDWLIAEKKKLQ